MGVCICQFSHSRVIEMLLVPQFEDTVKQKGFLALTSDVTHCDLVLSVCRRAAKQQILTSVRDECPTRGSRRHHQVSMRVVTYATAMLR